MIINYSESDVKLTVTYNRTDFYENSSTLDFHSDAMNNARWEIHGYEYESFSLYTEDLDAITFIKSLMDYTDSFKCTFNDDKVNYTVKLVNEKGGHLIVTLHYEPNELLYCTEPFDGESNLSIA